MNPDQIAIEPEIPGAKPNTAGMTTKVVKGSLWMIAGQVVPLGVSLVATYFVIRMLGAEGYGVLVLIALIPNYFVFADLGMSMASTKFGSEAYAVRNDVKEGQIVRTAALIAMLTSLPVAAAIFFFSTFIVTQFKVPDHLQAEGSLALKIASITFLVNLLCSIVNTPQLSRLRMDLNAFINTAMRVAGLIATPIVIYLGFGIVGVVTALLISNLAGLAGHLLVSRHLLRGNLFLFSIDRSMMRPLFNYGGLFIAASIPGVILINAEKGILAGSTSTTTLAFYSVSFTLASMLTMFSGSIVQSLLPAFSQLQTTDTRDHLSSLYSTGVRLNLIWIVPAIVLLFIVAKPFFTVWAGEEFGRESTMPFYILLAGVAFNLVAYLPYSSIMASGRVDALAKLFWIEVVPYIVMTVLLTQSFGIIGAAAAWSIRAIVDSGFQFLLATRVANVRFDVGDFGIKALFSTLIFVPTIVLCILRPDFLIWLAVLFLASIAVYSIFCWKVLLSEPEREWLAVRVRTGFDLL